MNARLNGHEDAERAATEADLRARVDSLVGRIADMAHEKLNQLINGGFDITSDHARGDGPYAVPREFIAALADEIKRDIGGAGAASDRARNRRINMISANMF